MLGGRIIRGGGGLQEGGRATKAMETLNHHPVPVPCCQPQTCKAISGCLRLSADFQPIDVLEATDLVRESSFSRVP